MSNETILDMAVVDEARTMMKSKFPTMVEYFLEDSAGYIASIRDAMTAKSVEGIITPAHTLKSSSRQMGAMSLSVLARQIEEIARQKTDRGAVELAPLVGDLDRVFGQTKEAFASI